MKIVWNAGSRTKVAAPVAAKALLDIEKETGSVMPAEVLRRARSKGHPLHPCFDWNDRVAAERWRLAQAQNLIYSLRVEEIPGEDPRPMFLNIAFGQGALSVEAIRVRPDLAASVLEQARRDLLSWRAKYESVKSALLPVFAAIEKVTPHRKAATRRSAS